MGDLGYFKKEIFYLSQTTKTSTGSDQSNGHFGGVFLYVRTQPAPIPDPMIVKYYGISD